MEKESFQKSSNRTISIEQHFEPTVPKSFVESRSEVLKNEVSTDMSSEVDHIPLPDVVPQRLNLQNLPQNLLRSAAVDTLLSQNEDLMLRLKVQLRRNADLEGEVQNLKEDSSDIIHELDRIRDELLIYKEKDKLFSSRSHLSQNENEALKNKIKFLETQYAELYSATKEKQSQLILKTQSLSRYKKYRNSLRKVAIQMRESIRQLDSDGQKERAINKDLMTKLGEAGERIQYISRQAKEDQSQLVESYESQLNSTRENLQTAQLEVSRLQKLANELEALKDERIEWQNTQVRIERTVQNERLATGKQIRELQEALASYRQDSKEKALQIASLEKDKNELLESNAHLKEERQALTEQVESLQCLWRDNQNQIEKMNSQIDSLQKLNQQLSQQMNQLRKDNADLRNRSESESFRSEERIKELSSQVNLLSAQKVSQDSETN